MKNLTTSRAAVGSPEWVRYRQTKINCSEIGPILGLSPYKSSLELFHEKIGTKPYIPFDNEATFWGRNLEDHVAKIWQAYDPLDPLGYMQNFSSGIKVRKCRNHNGSVYNDKYPWLSGSLDRLINIGQPTLDGQILDKEGILEIKTISGYEARKWENDIPPGYLMQIYGYMAILETEYAEIAILKDGRYFSVGHIPFNEGIINTVLSKTKFFYEERVKPAQEIMEHIKKGGSEHLWADIHSLEPPPDMSEAYRDYLSQAELTENTQIIGDDKYLNAALSIKDLQRQRKAIEEQENYYRSLILKELSDTSSEVMTFESGAKVSYKKNKNGVRFFNISIPGLATREERIINIANNLSE